MQLTNELNRKGIVGDWKTHFSAEESAEWDRYSEMKIE